MRTFLGFIGPYLIQINEGCGIQQACYFITWMFPSPLAPISATPCTSWSTSMAWGSGRSSSSWLESLRWSGSRTLRPERRKTCGGFRVSEEWLSVGEGGRWSSRRGWGDWDWWREGEGGGEGSQNLEVGTPRFWRTSWMSHFWSMLRYWHLKKSFNSRSVYYGKRK